MEKKNLSELINLLISIDSKEQMEEFLRGLLTPSELKKVSQRLVIVKMLKKGTPHQEIAGRLEVGVSTVTRGSRELQKGRFKNV